MKQEDKDLLLKDLCARLPYGAYVEVSNISDDEETYINDEVKLEPQHLNSVMHDIKCIKPYLRSLNKMTSKEQSELRFLCSYKNNTISNLPLAVDYLNKHMLDFRGLIPKGLALEAPKGYVQIIKGEY